MRVSRYGLILALALLAATATTAQKKPAEAPAGKAGDAAPRWSDVAAEPDTGLEGTNGILQGKSSGEWRQVGPFLYVTAAKEYVRDEETQSHKVVPWPALHVANGMIRLVKDGEGKPVALENFWHVSGTVLAVEMSPKSNDVQRLFRVTGSLAEVVCDAAGAEVTVNGLKKIHDAGSIAGVPHLVLESSVRRVARLVGTTLHDFQIPERMLASANIAVVGESVVLVGGRNSLLLTPDAEPLILKSPDGKNSIGTVAKTMDVAGSYLRTLNDDPTHCHLYRLEGEVITKLEIPTGKILHQIMEFGGKCFALLGTDRDGRDGLSLYELVKDSFVESKLLAGIKNGKIMHVYRRANDLIVASSAPDKKNPDVQVWTLWRMTSGLDSKQQPTFKVAAIAMPRNADRYRWDKASHGPAGTLWLATKGSAGPDRNEALNAKAELVLIDADGKARTVPAKSVDLPMETSGANSDATSTEFEFWDDGGWYLSTSRAVQFPPESGMLHGRVDVRGARHYLAFK